MKNKRKVFVIVLLMVVTGLCIYCGIETRYNKRILLTQFSGEGDGYIIETEKNNVIIIDGGTKNDANRIAKVLEEKGNPEILAWFLTSPEIDKTGAICEILKNYKNINVPLIYSSFNGELYGKYGLEEKTLEEIYENLDYLYSNENIGKLREMERRVSYQFDNYFITPLEVRDEGSLSNKDISNQNVILKVDNTFKNIIFFGSIGEEKAHYFKENDQDQFDCDAIQFSGNKLNKAGKEIFDIIEPEITIISDKKVPMFVKSEMIYTKLNGETVIEIW